MIVSLRGVLLEKTEDGAVVEAAGVGYAVLLSSSTRERLPAQHVLASTADPARTAAPDRTGIELVTLVVDQPELDAGPRGTGMLVPSESATVTFAGRGRSFVISSETSIAWTCAACGASARDRRQSPAPISRNVPLAPRSGRRSVAGRTAGCNGATVHRFH